MTLRLILCFYFCVMGRLKSAVIAWEDWVKKYLFLRSLLLIHYSAANVLVMC